MTAPDWIAVDWGTTHARAWAMQGSHVLAQAPNGHGMGTLAPEGFDPALRDMIDGWDVGADTPIIACGMVGSAQGWTDAGYRTVPARPLGEGLLRVQTDDPSLNVHIIPGLRRNT